MPANITSSARRSTPGGIPYTLMEGYPKGSVATFGKFESEEVYLIDATNLNDLIAELMPQPLQIDDEIIWVPRYSMPGTTWAYLKEISFEPFNSDKPGDPFGSDPNAASNTYEPIYAVTLKYNTDVDSQEDKDQNEPETFLERTLSGTVEMLTISANNPKIKYEQDNDEEAFFRNPTDKFVKVMPIVEHNYTWKQALNPNFVTMSNLLGCVNSLVHPWLLNAIAETVLFVGFGGRQEFQYLGKTLVIKPWQVDLKFAQKTVLDDDGDATPAGWNHVYNPDTQLFQRLIRKTTRGDRNLYRSVNFNNIFVP